MHTKAWRTEQMGSEGWSVFMPNPKLPRFEIVIASNMSEEHALLIAAAPELLEALESVVALIEDANKPAPNYRLKMCVAAETVLPYLQEALRKAKSQHGTLKGEQHE